MKPVTKILNIYGAAKAKQKQIKMMEWLSLLAVCNSLVWATDASTLYTMLPPNSLLLDPAFAGSVSPHNTSMPSKPAQVLSFSPDANTQSMSPMLLQPPGNMQYANGCDPSAKKEQFKKCLADQLDKLKNVLDNCKKTLGEDAKECCVDKKCLETINGNSSVCSDDDDDSDAKACRNKQCRDMIANEIIKNMNMDQFMKSMLNSLKGSLKKIGGRLADIASCGKNGCGFSGGLAGAGDISSGILIYPMDSSKYGAISSMLGNQQGMQGGQQGMLGGQGGPFQGSYNTPEYRPQSNPNNMSAMCSSNGWNDTNTQCPPSWTNQPSSWNSKPNIPPGEWANGQNAKHSSSLPACVPQMCASSGRYDSAIPGNCDEYCRKHYRNNKSRRRKSKESGGSNDLTEDESCSMDDEK